MQHSMENLKYYTATQVVAWVNLVCASLVAGALGTVLILVAIRVKHDSEVSVFGIVSLVVLFGMEILEVVSAKKLLGSTQPETNFADAAKKARFWQKVCIVQVVLSALITFFHFETMARSPGPIYFLARFVALFIVHNYIIALEKEGPSLQIPYVEYAVKNGSPANGTIITPPSEYPQQPEPVEYPNLPQNQTNPFYEP